MPCHAECKYHGFLGLVEWCRHPDNLGPLDIRLAEIEAAGGKCRLKVDFEAKVMPGDEPPWTLPVKLRELFPVENVPNGYKNSKKGAQNDTTSLKSSPQRIRPEPHRDGQATPDLPLWLCEAGARRAPHQRAGRSSR